jgi:hypothetical protein
MVSLCEKLNALLLHTIIPAYLLSKMCMMMYVKISDHFDTAKIILR